MPRSRRIRIVNNALERSLAAPQVVALRTLGALAAGDKPTARDRREWTRMGTEKVDAFSRASAAIGAQWTRAIVELPLAVWAEWYRAWLAASMTPWLVPPRRRALERHWQAAATRALDRGLAPLHRTAVANLRRLRRSKR
jgi:hypothetical protein